MCTATWTSRVPRCRPRGRPASSAVPDVLAPGLRCVFCGINPGRVSAAAHAHFANPRNDFWRLLHDAGFTPRLYEPSEQFELLDARPRRHERRLPDDPRLGRPAPRRLRRRPARADGPRASAARDRLRRQGGLPRRSSASAPSSARRRGRSATTALFVAPVDLAGERRRARTPSGSAGSARSTTGSSRVPRAAVRALARRRRRGGCSCCAGEIAPGAEWWITPGRRHRGRARPRRQALRRELARGDRARATPSSAPVVCERTHVLPDPAACAASTSGFYLVRVERHRGRRRRSTSSPRTSTATAGGRSTSSRRPTRARTRPPRAAPSSCAASTSSLSPWRGRS